MVLPLQRAESSESPPAAGGVLADFHRVHRSPRHMVQLFKRNSLGLVIHIVLWCLLIFLGGLYQADRALSLGVLLVFMLLSAARALHFALGPRLAESAPVLNYTLALIGLWAMALVWGAVACYVASRPELEMLRGTTFIVCAGIAAGGVNANSPDRLLAWGFAALLLLPAAAFMLVAPFPDRGLPLLMLVYLIYLLVVAKNQNTAFWQAFANEQRLEEKTAELERLNEVDFLTGLYNRRCFDRALELEVRRAARSGESLSLLVLDVDHFKNVNDVHGHMAGDECLRAVARVFEGVVQRVTDTVARIGGEEFAVLLPQTRMDTALRLAERIRQDVAALLVPRTGTDIRFTISIGVATRKPEQSDGPEALLAAADAALYRAKNSGRDRVCSAQNATAVPVRG
ncbi:MAG: GGDEF domain-containing protein [Proteobacteria bacterium]|nr:GGDEF domain-containing protein [Pseudomonadota bacterium]